MPDPSSSEGRSLIDFLPNIGSKDRRNIIFFFLLLLLVLAFLAVSLVYVAFRYYTDGLFSKIVVIVGIVLIFTISIVLVHAFIKSKIVCKSKFPICHDLWEEFKLCARCRGFYTGFALFGILLGVRNTIYLDLYKLIGAYPYMVITFLGMATVPIHGALRRVKKVESRGLLHITGFVHSSSYYLFGNLLVALLYGT